MTLLEAFQTYPFFLGIFAFVLGLILGSFYNVCIYRMPEDRPFWKGRSQCRSCRKKIPWTLNIPVVSYLYLRGRTACCKKPLSIQYPLVELATGLLFTLIAWCYGPTVHAIAYGVFFSWLLVISVIDLHHQIIPDELSLSGIPLGVLACFLTHDISWQSSVAGALVGGGVFYSIAFCYEKFSGQEGLGGGDVKLLAMLGAWLGIESILILIVLSTFLGSMVGIGLIAFRNATAKAAIPFGPFLAAAAALYVAFRPYLVPYFYPFLYS